MQYLPTMSPFGPMRPRFGHENEESQSQSSTSSLINGNGKKRSAPDSLNTPQQSKRPRKASSNGQRGIVDELVGNNGIDNYPELSTHLVGHNYKTDVPILRQVLDIQYTNAPAAIDFQDEQDLLGWNAEEENFLDMLSTFQESLSEPKSVDIGVMNIALLHNRLIGVPAFYRREWLLLLPAVDQERALEDMGIASLTSSDLLMACYVLRSAGKVTIQAQLKMIILPNGVIDAELHELPFRLQVELNVSLRFPAIFEPPAGREVKGRITEVSDAQLRLLRFVYGDPSREPLPFTGVANISYFYSILGPAPDVPPLAFEVLQPKNLLPTLLPFQRRSVAWLLNREGKEITYDGKIVPKVASDEYSFWDRIEEGNHTWYMNRLSGEMQLGEPPKPVVLGGILAEEPGLGKTLEMISLILLNPAPADRNPSLTRWDPEARLEVKAVKSTLIVTPSALASQWADELAAHSPKLRVLIYEGWSKLKVPIIHNNAMEEKRLKDLKVTSGKTKVIARQTKKKKKEQAEEDDEITHMDVKEVDDSTTHAPNGSPLEWCDYVQQFDVVIATYPILRSEFYVATAPPGRARREDVVYVNVERPRSPLVMVEWNRVIMDEVQMAGGGKIEAMVSLIPRLSSFAVSGTPARAQIADMIHVLKFLRVDGAIGSTKLWNRLLKPGFASSFTDFFQKYAIRTTKNSVQAELTIPQQTRYLVPIQLGKVERHVYDQTLEAILQDLGLDARGVAAFEGWEVDSVLLRSSLRRLRGICTHPQIGQLQNKKGDNLYKPGAIKDMNAVLQNIQDQNWRNLIDDWKSKIQCLILYSQLQQRDQRHANRYQRTVQTLKRAEQETRNLIQEIQAAITEHDEKGVILKADASAHRDTHLELEDVVKDSGEIGKGKGRQVSPEAEPDVASGGDPEEEGLPRTPVGDEHKAKRHSLLARLREARLVMHKVKFLQGDAYHVLGGPSSASEDAAYEEAEKIRRELLKATEKEANEAMLMLNDAASLKRFSQEDLVIKFPFFGKLGKKDSAKLMKEANRIVETVLNEQSQLLWEWRSRITKLLTQKLSPEEKEDGGADGQEYQRTLDSQGEAESFLQAYADLLADRREALENERTLLAAHNARERKERRTKVAVQAATEPETPDGVHFRPEDEALHLELSEQRKAIVQLLNGRAMKSVLVDLNKIGAEMKGKDSDPEKILIKTGVAEIRKLIADQRLVHEKLDADLAHIRKTFNQRIVYFRQLQEISDSVAEPEWEGPLEEALETTLARSETLTAKINTYRARQRYLNNLQNAKRNDIVANEGKDICTICECEFSKGFISNCAHIFCEGCMRAWLLRKEGKSCPVCRVPLDTDAIQRFSVDAEPPAGPPKSTSGEHAPRSNRQISYNKIDLNLLEDIQTMEAFGDFGTKIQTLVKHLLYLQLSEPGTKSIVFSAWADSLRIVEIALRENGIQCLRIDQNSKGKSAATKFRADHNISVLLLHGERENAGLNVTCASKVFMLESVVHHSFEIQAIARIDRMGQTNPTEVYCYYAEDTIEQNILDLAARKGLSLYTKDNSAGSLDISAFASDNEKAVELPTKMKVQKGDFIFKVDDMLAILFPHMYEDLEYLITPEDIIMQDSQDGESSNSSLLIQQATSTNAMAGPSRLRIS